MGNRQETRSAFVGAAGQLFAMRGVDGVSLKEIAAAAGVDSSMVKYHFGSKDGLVWAVVEHAVRAWKKDNLAAYYAEKKHLLATRDGQIVFLTGMVELMFRILHSPEEEDWCKSFVLQLIQRASPQQKKVIDTYIKPGVKTFFEVYRTITGSDDFESAFCWYLFMVSPLYMCSGSGDMIGKFHPAGRILPDFRQRLQIFTVRQMLDGFGLND